ncbi:MAG: phosphoadenylyl-sulfate reductase [Chloroflexi bacterium]|nr:phosphoadenylyl-sulfate reductase [Chloroflexota bacterium]
MEALGRERLALASSFGAEDMVILDMLVGLTDRPRVFTLDTGRLPQQTYDLMDASRRRYGIDIEVYFPQAADVEEMVLARGLNLFYESIDNRKECCGVRKVEPLSRALRTVDGWITGLRREQILTRAETPKIGLDQAHGDLWKVAPLAEWGEQQVWDYIRDRDVPYNALHDQGYPSIGCAPCTRAIEPGEDSRAGRWWWELPEQRECGLHFDPTTGRLLPVKSPEERLAVGAEASSF